MRPSSERQRRDLKTMVWGLLDNIGISAFAEMTRVEAPALSKYGAMPKKDGDPDERFIPLDVLLDAELRAGDPVVTRVMADLQGYDLVAQSGRPPVTALTIADVLKAQKETSDITAAYLAGIEGGGDLDNLDILRVRREIDEAQIVLSVLRKMVRA